MFLHVDDDIFASSSNISTCLDFSYVSRHGVVISDLFINY